MEAITLSQITAENWRATLQLGVAPGQQRFVAGYAPIALVVLAKAYVRAGGMIWTPFAIYAEQEPVGVLALTHAPDSPETCWLFHLFIDQRYQGQGYGPGALRAVVAVVAEQFPQCKQLRLTVHPENTPAQRVYERFGFQPTGELLDGELVYILRFV